MQHFTQAEIRQIDDRYQDFLNVIKDKFDDKRLARIDKAFRFANAAHDGIKRRSGEPYIIHPIAVARIVAKDLGLGATSICAAILHDVVEDTEYSINDIENMFGEKVARIVDGLTKLSGDFDSRQVLTLKKMLMTLSDDIRVILIKIADRLHNMQTLDSMPPHKKIKIAGETLYLYVPLAHRLGLNAIKTDLEELSFKYKHPEEYNKILYMLHNQEEKRNYLVNEFIRPIKEELEEEQIESTVTNRLKSSYSIWQKMQKKGITFNEIYDILAVRIIIKAKPQISEKRQCFDVLSLVTDIYKPKPDRIRDWITMPKANGYESLHVTVMGPQGKWVEVQIRTERMDEIAEHGFAAHYRYKDISTFENELDTWIERIREHLRSPESDAFEFLDDFKLNLYASEINLFTPKGDMVSLPRGSTIIDFAYEIHTELGNKCIGAKINFKLVPISHVLENGDQIEILTSEKQIPKLEWLKFATTAKARSKIKDAFKLEKKEHIDKGKEIVEEALKNAKAPITSNNLKKIIAHFNLNNKDQLYSEVGMGFLELDNLDEVLGKKSPNKLVKYWNITFSRKKKEESPEEIAKEEEQNKNNKIDRHKTFLLKEAQDNVTYSLAKCCNPIPGDKVIGYLSTDDHVIIHKTGCREVEKFLSSHGNRIIAAEWTKFKKQSYLTRLRLEGFDRVGIVNEVTNVISKQHSINMRSVKFDTHEGIFEGDLFLYIHNADDLHLLIARLEKIKGIDRVSRDENLSD
ncbi:GTP pyrophosphokinase [Mariniphaga anaerophila]|uniref:GTP pyrophosphokinase n=1 Tax=Mariniphaga anaerophila TaxID=1484053 RepID=A0A1M5FYC8_9BACT|nr:RelA/SpoT family protein [Mariniphaga anaerophila]SHF96557.1 GTP pyrophosphokinase [Mariniphaga anaerophila]